MSQMKTVETLTCVSCPGNRFYNLFNLKTHPNGGTSPAQCGYRCADCGADVDLGRLMEKAEKTRKMKEYEALRDELETGTVKSGKTSN